MPIPNSGTRPTGWPADTPPMIIDGQIFAAPGLKIDKLSLLKPAQGINYEIPAHQLQAAFATEVKNWETKNGHWEARKGTKSLVGPSMLLSIGGGPEVSYYPNIRFMGEHQTIDGSRYLIAIGSRPGYYRLSKYHGSVVSTNPLSHWEDTEFAAYQNPYSFVDALSFGNYIVFTTNTGRLIEWDPNATFVSSLTEISGSPYAHVGMVFGDRVVVAGINGAPLKIQWSVRNDHTDWTGIGSGYETLISGSGVEADEIRKLVALNNDVGVIFRERSIWHMTQTGIALTPYSFSRVVPGVGITAPWSAKNTPIGIIFIAEDNIYAYTLNGMQPIGDQIRTQVLSSIRNHETVYAAYDFVNYKYLLLVYSGESLSGPLTDAVLFVYNLRDGSWSRRVYEATTGITCIGCVSSTGYQGSINALIGSINDLEGTIDELAASQITDRMTVFGTYSGGVYKEDSSLYTEDSIPVDDLFTATAVPSELRTIELLGTTDPSRRIIVNQLKLEYIASAAHNIPAEYSVDGGVNWISYGTFTLASDSRMQLARINKVVQGYQLMFRITSTSLADIKVLSLNPHAIDAQPVLP